MINSKAQIIATIGPASETPEVLRGMMEHGLDVARLNFSWSDIDTRSGQITLIRQVAKELNKKIPIIVDLPGPRVADEAGHTYNHNTNSAITEEDKEFIKFAVDHAVEFIAVSFVGGKEDIEKCREIVNSLGGKQKIIAKIERQAALESLESIVGSADAVMVARGDMGAEIPLEQIPFIQEEIVKMSKKFGKPVIVATQMLLSMVENPVPTRAEVTDVENAIMQGADAVMLSEETAKGKYPVGAVGMMEKIILETERHKGADASINLL